MPNQIILIPLSSNLKTINTMKKFLLFITLFGSVTLANAQSLKEIFINLQFNKLTEAKAGIDKYMLDPKKANEEEANYLKGKVYESYSKDLKLPKIDAYNHKVTSFESFKKYLELDKKGTRTAADSNYGFLDIYLDLVNLGGAQFGEKNYADAFTSYSKAQEVEDYIFLKGYKYNLLKLTKLDTNLVLNTAAASINKGDSATATLFYTKLINAGLNSKDNEAIYDFVARYYMKKADAKNFTEVVSKAQKIYADNPYWKELEMDYLAKNDRPAMFAKYDEAFLKDPANMLNSYNYGIELYNNLYAVVKGKKDSAQSAKLITVLKAAVKAGSANDANVLLANHLYNTAAYYSETAEAIKSVKPVDVKKKKDLNSLSIASLNELIPYAINSVNYFKAQATLKTRDKINYRSAAGYLVEAYRATKNLVKSAEYDKLYNTIQIK